MDKMNYSKPNMRSILPNYRIGNAIGSYGQSRLRFVDNYKECNLTVVSMAHSVNKEPQVLSKGVFSQEIAAGYWTYITTNHDDVWLEIA